MHRGSSKADRDDPRPTESLPLSASPSGTITVDVEVARAGHGTTQTVNVVPGTLVRAILREIGQAPEGSVVLIDELPIPLDTPVDRAVRLVVLPTFSGG